MLFILCIAYRITKSMGTKKCTTLYIAYIEHTKECVCWYWYFVILEDVMSENSPHSNMKNASRNILTMRWAVYLHLKTQSNWGDRIMSYGCFSKLPPPWPHIDQEHLSMMAQTGCCLQLKYTLHSTVDRVPYLCTVAHCTDQQRLTNSDMLPSLILKIEVFYTEFVTAVIILTSSPTYKASLVTSNIQNGK
jgi:hypothetical protein